MVLARCSRLLLPPLSLLVSTLVSMVMLSPLTLASTATPEAQALIEELGLTEASTPIAKHPLWKPQKVVVMLPGALGVGSAEFEAQMTAARRVMKRRRDVLRELAK